MVDDFGLEELAMEAERHQFALDPEGLKDVSGKTGIVYGWHEMEGWEYHAACNPAARTGGPCQP